MSTAQSPGILRLFLTFLRLGATAFGGPGMVALRLKVNILWVVLVGILVSLVFRR